MKQFDYEINDLNGIHARPAGILAKEATKFQSEITIIKDEKRADAKRLFALMGLGVKYKDKVRFQIQGPDEEEAENFLVDFMQKNL